MRYAYRDRKARKRAFRALWITRINAAVRAQGMHYKDFIAGLKRKNILLSRDILAELAVHEPAVFTKIIEAAKN